MSEVVSPDGTLAFGLKSSRLGIYVERHQRGKGPRAAEFFMAAIFESQGDFERFCSTDRLRFEYPQTFQRLKQTFDDLVSINR